jgi:phosphoribosylpyrophosphate synthetase
MFGTETSTSLSPCRIFSNTRKGASAFFATSARTMIETVRHLNRAGMRPPICIGVHAIFAENAFKELLNSGIERVVTCNSVPHPSNAIDLSDLYIDFIENFEKATF